MPPFVALSFPDRTALCGQLLARARTPVDANPAI
jgi:hypothetical protein